MTGIPVPQGGQFTYMEKGALTPSCGTCGQFHCFTGPQWLASKYFCIIPVTTPAMKLPRSWEFHIIFASPLLSPPT